MKKVISIVVLVVVLGFVSCTDNDKIVPENEKQELFGVDKGDIGANEEPDYRED